MSIQVNIFSSGSVPTATELANFINELNTDLDSIVTLNTDQIIEGVKTFWGSKLIKFKQKAAADKLGFTLYDSTNKEVGNFEYDNKDGFKLFAMGNYYSAANKEVESYLGFKIYNKLQTAAYRLLCPLGGDAKTNLNLSETYTNFYFPLIFANGNTTVTADNTGKVDLSTLIGSGGTLPDLATVATTGDYDDLLNKPTLFSGSYNDLTNKPTLFSGDYNDLSNKPTIPDVSGFVEANDLAAVATTGDYDDLINKPTLFSGSYNDLTNKPTLFSGSYNDLSDKPTIPTVPAISTNITTDAASDTKTASPKAVKDFVEGKGYLTQHQDISGKADQTDLEDLEDRVEALEQSGGSTPAYSYLKLISDLDAYTSGPVGEIVKYVGQTKYTNGWDYKKVQSGTYDVTIPAGTMHTTFKTNSDQTWNDFLANTSQDFYMYETVQGWSSSSLSAWCLPNPEVGDYVYKGSRMCPVTAVNGFMVTFVRDGQTLTADMSGSKNLYHFINQDGVSIYSTPTPAVGSSSSSQLMVFDTGFTTYAGYNPIDTAATEVVIHMGTPQISWEPILMPTENSIDNSLSQVSENALQNKVLYDELRITESGNGGTIEVVSYLNGGEPAELQVVDIDLNDCSTKRVDPEDPNNSEVFYVIDGFVNGYAYNLKNADGKTIVFTGQTPTLFKFNDTIDEGVQTISEFGFTTDFGDIWNTENPVGKFFVPSYTPISGYDRTYYAVTGTTEIETTSRTVSSSVTTIKSLKTKIAELEARIAALEGN